MPSGSGFEGLGGLGEGACHWRAKGPKGMTMKFDVISEVAVGSFVAVVLYQYSSLTTASFYICA